MSRFFVTLKTSVKYFISVFNDEYISALVLGMVSLTCLIGYLISGFASRDKGEKGEWDGSLLGLLLKKSKF